MKKQVRIVWLVALVLPLLLSSTALAIDKQEVITLAQLGISGEEIVKAIEKDRTIFNLEVNDILELKNAGVPEEVIRFMLSTPQKYGKPAEGTAVTDPVKKPEDAGTKEPVVEKTPEEIRAEAERARLEAQRLSEQRKKAQEQQQKLYLKNRLKEGMDLAEQGDFVGAIQQFDKLTKEGEFAPGSDEQYAITYGTALALLKAGMLRSAADGLLEVVLQGPDKPFFQDAFLQLRTVRKRIAFSPPNIEQLTRFFVGNLSREFQDSFNYFLGEFFYEGANYSLALKYFDEVSEGAPEYASALYLKGLVHVGNQMYKTAVQNFQEAVLAQEQNKSDERVSHLAYMALARIAYELGDYDASIFYYRKVPRDSIQLPTAFYESAWCYFAKGDFSRALGTFHALHSPYFNHYFYPELWILEATVYLNSCHYDSAKDALEMFRRHVSVLGVPLRKFMQSMRTPAEYYMAVLKIVRGDKSYSMPMDLLYPVLSNVDFYRMHETIVEIDKEKALMEKNRAALGDFAEEKLAVLESDRVARMNEIGIRIQQILRDVEAQLREYEVKVTEIELDLNQVEMEKIEMQTQMLLLKEKIDRAVQALIAMAKRNVPVEKMIERVKKEDIYRRFKSAQLDLLKEGGVDSRVIQEVETVAGINKTGGGSVAIVGSDSLEWPFEGDYWSDELWGFRSFLKQECMK